MLLKKIRYEEFKGSQRHWKLEECEFTKTNLVVGKNSTGKSRLVNLISALAHLITGKTSKLFTSGSWDIEIGSNNETIRYQLFLENSTVISESLSENGVIRFTRKGSNGEIWYAEENKFIKIVMPEDQIIPSSRRDDLQHPFVTKLHKWATLTEQHLFGSDYGKNQYVTGETVTRLFKNIDSPEFDTSSPTITYIKGYEKYKKKFDRAIINDMEKLGYNLADVGCTDLDLKIPGSNTSLFGLFTREKYSKANCEQMNISQGQFRALALTIHINYLKMSKNQKLLLIDDVGEGLDYERATGMIDVLMKTAEESDIQIIMTSNDKFVMNKVPLENWIVLKRTNSTVKNFTSKNSKEKFEDFKFMGLNNFDIFSSDFL
ncbi:hypothetical protein ACNFIA_13225 [Pseudomonas sp. NY15437]|uniref:hypothetical protein n=1 Tax=Pseudomonas sp. NY15437 TaxID=3400360 RepID=UPI003A83D96B